MDCSPSLLNYLYPPDDMNSLEHKFVASGIMRTMFYCLNRKLLRFNVSDHAMEVAQLMGGKISAFIEKDGKLPQGSTISFESLKEDLTAQYHQGILYVNPQMFCDLKEITLTLSVDDCSIQTDPRVFPTGTMLTSPYFCDVSRIDKRLTYLPHVFYNDLVNKYGPLNSLTALVAFIALKTKVTQINITGSTETPLEIFKLYDIIPQIVTKINPDHFKAMLRPSFVAFTGGQSTTEPNLSFPNLVLSFPPHVTDPVSELITTCILCHISSLHEWNELAVRLLKLPISSCDLLFTVYDNALTNLIKATFPKANIVIVRPIGSDMGGFLQGLSALRDKTYMVYCKIHFEHEYSMRKESLDFLQQAFSEVSQGDLLSGAPIIKMDYMHANHLAQYVRKYGLTCIPSFNHIRTSGQNPPQINRSSVQWQTLSKKTKQTFIPSGIFVARANLFKPDMIECVADFTTATKQELLERSATTQSAELAWLRFLGILGNVNRN